MTKGMEQALKGILGLPEDDPGRIFCAEMWISRHAMLTETCGDVFGILFIKETGHAWTYPPSLNYMNPQYVAVSGMEQAIRTHVEILDISLEDLDFIQWEGATI